MDGLKLESLSQAANIQLNPEVCASTNVDQNEILVVQFFLTNGQDML